MTSPSPSPSPGGVGPGGLGQGKGASRVDKICGQGQQMRKETHWTWFPFPSVDIKYVCGP